VKQKNSTEETMLKAIDVNKIDPSPFQIRQYRDEGKLKELGASIERKALD